MAATALTVHAVDHKGIAQPAAVATDTTNGNSIPNETGLGLLLIVNNPGAASATITFVTPGTVEGLPVGDEAVTIAAGATQVFGSFPEEAFGSSVQFNSSAALNVTAYAVQPTR